ncbi:MAG TPA: L-rhamnose mutarotase [Bryobacteraceae bacterium]|nr:L-rhamnose mutarotase [Bryobacteraceae bacterium]
MIRKAFAMTLLPGMEEEYRRRHNPIWPELSRTLSEHGVHNYSIFLDGPNHRLFAYAEIESESRWNQIAGTPVCREWWTSMKELMVTNADESPAATDLPEVFHLD